MRLRLGVREQLALVADELLVYREGQTSREYYIASAGGDQAGVVRQW